MLLRDDLSPVIVASHQVKLTPQYKKWYFFARMFGAKLMRDGEQPEVHDFGDGVSERAGAMSEAGRVQDRGGQYASSEETPNSLEHR
jgi:hypothetical protein